ncbi:hypothetical protein FACS189423_06100 [Bacteroidia bacterium]|nr:hypothetical protein FACS189423_06100 [Bacteroidia bacterium]
MATMAFHYRPSLREGLNKGSLFIRIIHDRKVKTVTTNYRIFPYEWDNVCHCFVFPENDAIRKKQLIEMEYAMQEDIQRLEVIIQSFRKRDNYTINDILEKFCLTPADDMLSSYTEKLSRELISNGQNRTARAYRTVAKGLIHFNNGKDIRLKHINPKFIRDYERYLKNHRENVNTISFYMRHLRAIYRKAIREEMIHSK